MNRNELLQRLGQAHVGITGGELRGLIASKTVARIRAILDGCKFARIGDISPSCVACQWIRQNAPEATGTHASESEGPEAIERNASVQRPRLWPGTWCERGADMLRRDLAKAGIPYRDEAGACLTSIRSGTSSSATWPKLAFIRKRPRAWPGIPPSA